MGSVNLYKNSYRQNLTTFNTVSIDLTDLQEGDINWIDNITSTYAATGDIIHLLRFDVPLQGIGRVSGYDEDPDSPENLCPRPSYTTTVLGEEPNQTYEVGILPNKEEVPIGEKPDDWEAKYPLYYYTRRTTGSGNTTYELMDHAAATWNNTTQYYKDTTQQVGYYTGSMGFFGVSRGFGIVYNGVNNIFAEQFYVCLPFGTRPYHTNNSDFLFKSGGMFGNPIFNSGDWGNNQSIPFYISVERSPAPGLHKSTSKTLIQMCEFSYTVSDSSHDEPYEADFTGIVVIQINPDNTPAGAAVVAVQKPFWTPIEKKAKGGPSSSTQGGNGNYTALSNDRGDEDGQFVQDRVDAWNNGARALAHNQNHYRIYPNGGDQESAWQEMIQRLWSPWIWDVYDNQFFNPTNAILSCLMMPHNLGPDNNGTTAKIKAAEINLSTHQVPCFTDFFERKPIGIVDISQYYDGFPDYDNTGLYIHLPYIGTFQLDIPATMGRGTVPGKVRVDYVSDVQTGDVVAWVWIRDADGHSNYRYEFKGNCAMPVQLQYRSATLATSAGQAVLNTALQVIAEVATAGLIETSGQLSAYQQASGGTSLGQAIQDLRSDGATGGQIRSAMSAGAARSMFSSLSNSINAAMGAAGSLATNAHGGRVSAPVDTQCYLIITRPVWSNPSYYGELFGYPSDIAGQVSDFNGFLKTRASFLDNIPCTDDERAEISGLLANGVYLRKPNFTVEPD